MVEKNVARGTVTLSGQIVLEVRETYGMNTIDEEDVSDVRNRTTSFLLGFRFWLE